MRPVVYPADFMSRETPPALEQFSRRYLAEGDSWFTIGTLNFFDASNLLYELELERRSAVISAAYPGDTLQHMVEFWKDPYFRRLLSDPKFALDWDGILLSAGGNDLIDAVQVPPSDEHGNAIEPHRRILLTPVEAAQQEAAGPAARYVSEAGWTRFAGYLTANFGILVDARDTGPNAGRPIFLHTYAVPTVRPSGAHPGSNGWLFPAFESAGIPTADRQAVSDLLFARLRRLLLDFDSDSATPNSLPQVHVFDSAALTSIVAAEPDATGASNDWANEIHLTWEGYRKVGRMFGPFIEGKLSP
jgi:hypothetical protein